MESADHDRPKRVRGVVLTPKALELLQVALAHWWIAEGNAGRPDLDDIAVALAISVQTVNRILDQTGVDKRTLQSAFARINIPWKDSYSIAAHNLRRSIPSPLTDLIGRDEDLKAVEALLASRLVTLIGCGGVGKTRLALHVAGQVIYNYADGVAFVDLAGITDGSRVIQAVADSLDVRDKPDTPLQRTLLNFLRNKHLLLLLDNCEHIRADCAELVQTLLHACPRVTVLATSRAALGVPDEVRREVIPLLCPAADTAYSVSALLNVAAVALFVSRAKAVRSDFAITSENITDIARLCRQLEGLPLALELAAAWAAVYNPGEMRDQLSQRFTFLTHERPTGMARHHSLGAALRVSYMLLPDELRMLFRCLSVFVGGWTLDSAEAVCRHSETPRALMSLHAHSLITAQASGATMRFRMLETVREFAWEQLSTEERQEARQRHADWCLRVAQEIDSHFDAPDQVVWLDRFECEQANMWAALAWCRDFSILHSNKVQLGLKLITALINPWRARGNWRELKDVARDLLARVPESEQQSEWYLGVVVATLFWDFQDTARAREIFTTLEQIDAFYQKAGNLRGIASALSGLAWAKHEQQEYQSARLLFVKAASVVALLGDEPLYARLINGQGIASYRLDDFAAALRCAEEAVLRQKKIGTQNGVMQALFTLGMSARALNDLPTAAAAYKEGLTIARQIHWKIGSPYGLEGQAYLEVEQGNHSRAACLMGCAAAIRERSESPKPQSERREYDGYMALVRQSLSEEEFVRAWQAGRNASWEDVISLAVREIPDSALLGAR